jgi:phage-related baseplate assembly protein
MALKLKAERQIQGEILARLISQLGLNDVNPASVVDIFTQSISQQHFSLYYQIAQITRLVDIDSLTGDDLDNKGFEYGLFRDKSKKGTGYISILRESTFVKVSTTFFAGSSAPRSGDLQIDVNDASNALISTSGTLILGRNTNNEEEVDYSAAPTNMGNFWRFVLDNPLVNDHAQEETVILRQGNDEVIVSGTTVVVSATGASAEIKFQIDNDTTLPSGEDKVEDVEVTAILSGESGNIGIGAIDGESAFPSPPFSGARARNDVKFTTARDREEDDDFRDRIKRHVQGLSKAVKQAILNAIVGLVDPETAKRVISASVVLPVIEAGAVKIYIDDGRGFEPVFESQGFETIRSSTSGGEQRLNVDRFPVSKAQIESNTPESYDMSAGSLTLIIQVGTTQETITFANSDFRFPEIASAEEIVSAINDRSTLVEARTSQIGKYVLISAKRDENESLQVIGGTANSIINFPTDLKDTINLYVDDVKKSKDGQTATIDSGNQAPYNLNAIGSFPFLLNIVVDGKTANPQVATFASIDTVDVTSVTAAEICAVINRDIAGVVATPINSGTKVRIESLTKLSASSKVHITGGTLNNVTNGLNFSTVQQVGITGDYVFNRELGIIEFANPLVANQSITLGSLFTRAKIRASLPENYAPTNTQTLVISVDGGANQTITFDGTFTAGKSAEDTATFINATLVGAKAVVREVGGLSYLEIRTNTYATTGSIEIKSASTSNAAFGFTLNTAVTSGDPNKAYLVSGNAGPYSFAQADTLVAIINNDIVNNTFSIPMNYAGNTTLGTSTTIFRDSSLPSVFPTANQLVDYYIAFTSGSNTLTGTVTTVAHQSGSTYRYTFDPVPGSFTSFAAVGSLVKIEDLDDSENNGYFVVTGAGASYIEVTNSDGVNASGQTGTGVLSQRRRVTAYSQLTGAITVGVAFAAIPSLGDSFLIIPSTINNLVDYMNNTKITSFTLKGVVEGVTNNTKIQLSSKSEGSDGYIQVTGGNANRGFGFSTVVYRGLQAYNYWTGLTKLVHKTIYGDDSDLTSYPGVGAAGVMMRVLAPTVRDISVELDITLQDGVSITSVENDVKSAVTGYINTLGLGDDVIIERIRAAVIAIPGITDVVINDPTENIVIADNEKANVADPDILIG